MGLLERDEKKDKEFWKDGEHTHKLEESRKMDFFFFLWLPGIPCTDVKVRGSVFYGTTRSIFRALDLGTQLSWLNYLLKHP